MILKRIEFIIGMMVMKNAILQASLEEGNFYNKESRFGKVIRCCV